MSTYSQQLKGGRISVPKRYVPKQLSKKDKKKQAKELKKSRKAYKKGKYYTRKKLKSFKGKVSSHIIKARKMYKVDKITPNKKLAKASGCKIQGLRKIVQKGQGAYFSSGSRPNQTGHSWGYARMASAITGGKSAAVDYKILQKYCTNKSKALKLAKKIKGKGTRKVKQVKIGGNLTKNHKSTRKNKLKNKLKKKLLTKKKVQLLFFKIKKKQGMHLKNIRIEWNNILKKKIWKQWYAKHT